MSKKKIGLYLKVSQEEKQMINEIRSKYCVNISQLIKRLIKQYYATLKEKENGQKS